MAGTKARSFTRVVEMAETTGRVQVLNPRVCREEWNPERDALAGCFVDFRENGEDTEAFLIGVYVNPILRPCKMFMCK